MSKVTPEQAVINLLGLVEGLLEDNRKLHARLARIEKVLMPSNLKDWQLQAIKMKAEGKPVKDIVHMAPVSRQSVSAFLNKPETLIQIEASKEQQ